MAGRIFDHERQFAKQDPYSCLLVSFAGGVRGNEISNLLTMNKLGLLTGHLEEISQDFENTCASIFNWYSRGSAISCSKASSLLSGIYSGCVWFGPDLKSHRFDLFGQRAHFVECIQYLTFSTI